MRISDLLSPAAVMLDVVASNKQQLLQDLAGKAAGILGISEDLVAAELLRREELGSTGTGGGIATPHAKIAGVARPFGILAKLRQPMDFDSIDRKPVDLVFMILMPSAGQGEQIGPLACVARKLREPESLAQMRRAHDAAGLYAAAVA